MTTPPVAAFLDRCMSSAISMALSRGHASDGWLERRELNVIVMNDKEVETLGWSLSRARGYN